MASKILSSVKFVVTWITAVGGICLCIAAYAVEGEKDSSPQQERSSVLETVTGVLKKAPNGTLVLETARRSYHLTGPLIPYLQKAENGLWVVSGTVSAEDEVDVVKAIPLRSR